MAKEKRAIENIKSIMTKNHDDILSIVVSNDFMQTLSKYPELIDIDFHEDEDFGEVPLLFNVPIIESNNIQKNAILEMKSGEYIILKLNEEE